MNTWILERARINRLNVRIQTKNVPSHSEVYDQVNQDIRDVCNQFGTDLNEILSHARTRKVADARAVICIVALERLRPLGISDSDIAKFLGIHRTTMLFAAQRWKKKNGHNHGEVIERKRETERTPSCKGG